MQPGDLHALRLERVQLSRGTVPPRTAAPPAPGVMFFREQRLFRRMRLLMALLAWVLIALLAAGCCVCAGTSGPIPLG